MKYVIRKFVKVSFHGMTFVTLMLKVNEHVRSQRPLVKHALEKRERK